MQALVGHAAHEFAGVQFQGRGGFGAEVAALVGVHAGVQKRLGGGDVGGAGGQRKARVLELANGLAKSLALLHVALRYVQRPLGAVYGLHADDEALAR